MDPVLKAFDEAVSRLRSRYSELVGECYALRAALVATQPLPEPPADTEAKLLLTLDEAAARLRIRRTMVYKLMNDGRLSSVKVGGKRLIPASAIDDNLRSIGA